MRPSVSFAREPAVQYLINAAGISSSSRKDNYSGKPLVNRNSGRASMETPPYIATLQKVGNCIEQLQELGYIGYISRGGADDKLRNLVRSVDGDLEKAIDAIEEDRSAWDSHNSGKKQS